MSLALSFIPIGIIGGVQGFQYASVMLIGLIFLVTFLVSLTISFFITRPLEKLTHNIDEISKGKLDVTLSNSEIFEIDNLTDSLNRVMASLKLAMYKVGLKKGEIFEDAVKAKEETVKKQEDILNSINGWAWEIDARGIYTFCSKNISDFLGYKSNEIIGRNYFDFIAPEDAKNLKLIFSENSKKKTQIKNLDNNNINKKGKIVCFSINAFPFYDEIGTFLGYRGVNTDVNSEKIKDLTIKQLNTDLTNLKMEITDLLNERDKKRGSKPFKGEYKSIDDKWSEHEFDSVFIFDENANILDCNENTHKRLGYTKSEMLALNMSDFDALESKEEIKNKINVVKKNGSFSFKTIHKRKDGSAILVFENLQYLPEKNKFIAIVREDFSLKKSSK